MSDTNATAANQDAASTYKPALPALQEFLKSGVQFGHQTKKWNPLMKDYIFSKKEGIHIVDLSKTLEQLEKAMVFLHKKTQEGPILIVGTKRQASEIVQAAAMEAGTYFVTHRWPGGLFTNFPMIQRSLKSYTNLEVEFDNGVEGRTKFEVSKMKKLWEKMNRIYGGIKTMTKLPSAVIIVDMNFERGAIKECRAANIPVVAIVDTNSNPNLVEYPIPANDDAIRSVKLIMSLLAQAIKDANKGNGVKHDLKDYTKFEVKIIKTEPKKQEGEAEALEQPVVASTTKIVEEVAEKPKRVRKTSQVGMLEKIQKESESKKTKTTKKK